MNKRIIVTGTDTGIGKTVFSAGLAGLLDGFYWKPVQSGLDGETDSEVVARLAGRPPGRVLPEAYSLEQAPVAASFSRNRRRRDRGGKALASSLAGSACHRRCWRTDGAAQPTDNVHWHIRAMAAAGHIVRGHHARHHTLFSIEALRARSIPLIGVAFIGDEAGAGAGQIDRAGAAEPQMMGDQRRAWRQEVVGRRRGKQQQTDVAAVNAGARQRHVAGLRGQAR